MTLTTLVIDVIPTHAQVGQAEVAKRRAELEVELAKLEKLIQQQQELLSNKQGERVTLERDLAILDGKISKARLDIRARELAIAKLQDDIIDKEATIATLVEKIDRQRETLSELVRKRAETDDTSLVEVVLSGKSFSDFFEELEDVEAIKLGLHSSFDELEHLMNENREVKRILEERHLGEVELKQLQLLQKKKLDEQEGEKNRILKSTKGQEAEYQRMIRESEKSATEIRSELFELRGSAAIQLGDAIEYANFASAKTGVRPAFILGILKQETRLGEFLGNGVWTEDMHPTRDRPVFKTIVETLGLDANRTPVSKKPGYGWGGAMGPAQFIPSTWACYGGYIHSSTGTCSNTGGMTYEAFWAGPWRYDASKDRIRSLRGKASPGNPWDNQDAFIASAVYMMDLGAAGGNHAKEREAALRYFAGGNWSNPAYAFYGDGVMEHAAYFQKQIDTLKRLSEEIKNE